jgi:geranylgeranyl pyrophosphate synthase
MSMLSVDTPAAGFAPYHARLKRRIDAELDVRLAEWFPGLALPHLQTLSEVMSDGKRLRGSLTCLVAEALGGSVERALPAALAIEIIQAASLVHDDFIDGDALRRGRPAAWTVLSPRRAVLLADVMFATAIEKMAQAGAREGATLSHAIATMAQGAFQETLDLDAGAARRAYRHINYLKTGSLFAAAARLGALAAGAGGRELEAATEFGALAGEAYQIADDLADITRLGSGTVARAQLPALAPALAYFTGKTDFAQAVPLIRPRMEEEIASLIGRAKASLAPFPGGEPARVLAELPGAVAGMAA